MSTSKSGTSYIAIQNSCWVCIAARIVVLVFAIAAFSTQYWNVTVFGGTVYSYSIVYLQTCIPSLPCFTQTYYNPANFPPQLMQASTWGAVVLSLFIIFEVAISLLSVLWIRTLSRGILFWPYRVYYTQLVDVVLLVLSIVFNCLMAQNTYNYANANSFPIPNWSAGFPLSIVTTILCLAPIVLSFDTTQRLFDANIEEAHGLAGLAPAPSRKRIDDEQMQHV